MARDEDLDDDALEREHANPYAAGNAVRHAPKLSDEPRAISLREVREVYELPSERRREEQMADEAPAPPPARQPLPSRRPQLEPLPSTGLRAAMNQLRGPGRVPTFRGAAEPTPTSDAAAWDRYAAAALAVVVPVAEDIAHAVVLAAECADLLLEERKRRFMS